MSKDVWKEASRAATEALIAARKEGFKAGAPTQAAERVVTAGQEEGFKAGGSRASEESLIAAHNKAMAAVQRERESTRGPGLTPDAPDGWDGGRQAGTQPQSPVVGSIPERNTPAQGDFPPSGGTIPTPGEASRSRVSMHLDKVQAAAAEREIQREAVRRSSDSQTAKNVKIADLNRAEMAELAKAERIMEVVGSATTSGGKATANLTTMIAERSANLDEALEQVEKIKGTTLLDEFPVSLPLLRQNLEKIFGKGAGMFKNRPPTQLSERLRAVNRAHLERGGS